jgi:hypothetical protein
LKELVDVGLFETPEEAVLAAVWLLQDEFSLYKVKRDEVHGPLQASIDQLDRGEAVPCDVVFAKLRENIEKRARQSP